MQLLTASIQERLLTVYNAIVNGSEVKFMGKRRPCICQSKSKSKSISLVHESSPEVCEPLIRFSETFLNDSVVF